MKTLGDKHLIIGTDIMVTVVDIHNGTAYVGVNAPSGTPIRHATVEDAAEFHQTRNRETNA